MKLGLQRQVHTYLADTRQTNQFPWKSTHFLVTQSVFRFWVYPSMSFKMLARMDGGSVKGEPEQVCVRVFTSGVLAWDRLGGPSRGVWI